MILSGKTVSVLFKDGRRETVDVLLSDEMDFEEAERIALTRVLSEGGAVPTWVVGGIVHRALLRSGVPDIPAERKDFVNLLEDDFFELVTEGKAAGSGPIPSTG